ncbi:helix-turn-helix domain-containing protein [Streptomyces sp. NPDC046939]|uniref:winged helix-turn-helix transcriptional regulator n=1 Tax=Streptomyces sp. NPDC046939 TaxID=3155376 RepID=UPI0033D77DB1
MAETVTAGPGGASGMLREVLATVGDKWSVTVICRLSDGPVRFNELRRRTEGITQRMLSRTLKNLERDGLVIRTVHPTVPPRVEYALTGSGDSLHTVLYGLVQWTEGHLEGIVRARAAHDARSAAPSQGDGGASGDAAAA